MEEQSGNAVPAQKGVRHFGTGPEFTDDFGRIRTPRGKKPGHGLDRRSRRNFPHSHYPRHTSRRKYRQPQKIGVDGRAKVVEEHEVDGNFEKGCG